MTSKENFLHLFTPDQPKVIAIEPMTGAANNFNNKIGLQTLEPNDVYKVEWDIAIDTLNTKVKSNKLINKLPYTLCIRSTLICFTFSPLSI